MANILPLTPGLLISMAIRNDHSFGFHMGSFETGTLEEKQIRLIDRSYQEYLTYENGGEIQNQRLEELTGEGFYRPEREKGYLANALPKVRDHAIKLCQRSPKADDTV